MHIPGVRGAHGHRRAVSGTASRLNACLRVPAHHAHGSLVAQCPVNNRFADLRNQLALAYEGDSENLSKKLKTGKSVEEIFRGAQASFNAWDKLPTEERTARAILDSLDFDFFELLDSVTIARSRKHIQTFYDTTDIGQFPERRKPLSFHCPLTARPSELHHDVLHCIDGAVQFPMIFELTFGSGADALTQVVAAYKRPSDADASRWVLTDYFATQGWMCI